MRETPETDEAPALESSRAARVRPAARCYTHAREVVSAVAREHGVKVSDMRIAPGRSLRVHPHRDAIEQAVRVGLAEKFTKREIADALGVSDAFVRRIEKRWT